MAYSVINRKRVFVSPRIPIACIGTIHTHTHTHTKWGEQTNTELSQVGGLSQAGGRTRTTEAKAGAKKGKKIC